MLTAVAGKRETTIKSRERRRTPNSQAKKSVV